MEIFLKAFEFLSSAKNILKILSVEHTQKLFDSGKKPEAN